MESEKRTTSSWGVGGSSSTTRMVFVIVKHESLKHVGIRGGACERECEFEKIGRQHYQTWKPQQKMKNGEPQ